MRVAGQQDSWRIFLQTLDLPIQGESHQTSFFREDWALYQRRQEITERLFNNIVNNESHGLHGLFLNFMLVAISLVLDNLSGKRCSNSFMNYNVVHSSQIFLAKR